jgi:alcohol dehydrogenase
MTFRVSTLTATNGSFEAREQDVPTLTEDGLVVRVELAGVCVTWLRIAHDHIPGCSYPSTLGHEVCGIVESVGPGFGSDVRNDRHQRHARSR